MISQHFIQVKYDNYSIYIHFHKLCFCSSNYDIPSGNSSIVYQLHSYVSLPIGNFPLVIFHSCSHQKQRHLHLHFHREFIPSSASGRWGRRSAMRSYSAEVGRGLDDNLGETVLNGVLSWIYIYTWRTIRYVYFHTLGFRHGNPKFVDISQNRQEIEPS